MKKSIIVLALALSLVLSGISSAYAAASTEEYTLVAPRLRADVYSSSKAVNGLKDFGVKHKWSGTYPIRFTVCNSSKQAIGATVTIYPGGAAAPLTDLWYNATATTQNITVRMDSSKLNYVRILCEGTWVWNY